MKKTFKANADPPRIIMIALLHPDRHPDPTLKSAADNRFQAVNRAFEVLSDPRRRMIYDALGEEGLKTTWEVGSKYKTSSEVSFEILYQVQSEEKWRLIHCCF